MHTDAVHTYTQLAAIVRSLGGQLPGQLGGVQAGAKQAELSHAQALLQNALMTVALQLPISQSLPKLQIPRSF